MGVKLGCPKGSRNKHHILEPHRDYIIRRKKNGKTNNYIKTHLGCHLNTLKAFLELEGIE